MTTHPSSQLIDISRFQEQEKMKSSGGGRKALSVAIELPEVEVGRAKHIKIVQ